MVIVSSFKVKYNNVTGLYEIISIVTHSCPDCKGDMFLRDYVKRKSIDLYGETRTYVLRRLECVLCETTHRELPDFIQPRKHYDSEAIQSTLDGKSKALGCMAHDTTMWRWRREFKEAEPDISQRLSSVYAAMTGGIVPIFTATEILSTIKSKEERWLPYVTELLINSGHKLCTRFAICPQPIGGKVSPGSKIKAERGEKHEPAITDTG